MTKYIGFREQLLKCKENGNLIEDEHCQRCSQKLLLCKKYGGQCISSKCLAERTQVEKI